MQHVCFVLFHLFGFLKKTNANVFNYWKEHCYINRFLLCLHRALCIFLPAVAQWAPPIASTSSLEPRPCRWERSPLVAVLYFNLARLTASTVRPNKVVAVWSAYAIMSLRVLKYIAEQSDWMHALFQELNVFTGDAGNQPIRQFEHLWRFTSILWYRLRSVFSVLEPSGPLHKHSVSLCAQRCFTVRVKILSSVR